MKTKVSVSDIDTAVKALSIHMLGDLCNLEDVPAITRVRDWLEAEQLNRNIKSVARETGHSIASIRATLTKCTSEPG
jgi:hypothetical protein